MNLGVVLLNRDRARVEKPAEAEQPQGEQYVPVRALVKVQRARAVAVQVKVRRNREPRNRVDCAESGDFHSAPGADLAAADGPPFAHQNQKEQKLLHIF